MSQNTDKILSTCGDHVQHVSKYINHYILFIHFDLFAEQKDVYQDDQFLDMEQVEHSSVKESNTRESDVL